MIRHSEKNSKKKLPLHTRENHRERCEMDSDGDIHINANHLVMLPKPPAETKPSSAEPPAPTNEKEILIHCLVNRSLVLKHPKQKKHLNNRYYVCFWAVH